MHAGEITLPAGVEIAGDSEQVVIHIVPAPTAEELEAEVGEVEAVAADEVAEPVEGAEAAEAAPAEGDSAQD